MKTDLTALPRADQVAAVVRHLEARVARRHPSDKALFASDLMGHFKHHGLKTHMARIAFYSEIQREAVATILAGARAQMSAAPVPASVS